MNIIFLAAGVFLLLLIVALTFRHGLKIQTKLMVAFFLISLMPIIPLAFLMDSLVERSLDVGVNQKVIAALESAKALAERAEITSKADQELFAHKERVKECLRIYSSLDLLRSPIEGGYLVVFLFLAMVMLILAFLASLIISKKLTRPLKELVRGLEEVAKGNLDFQVQVETRDETAKVAASFNQMVKELKESREQLIAAEREAAWRGIAQRIAHEIKNPLTPIQLSLEHLRDKFEQNPQEYQKVLNECTQRIGEEVETLRKMAKEFSEFARMPEANYQMSDLNSLLKDTLSLFLPLKPDIEANYGINLPRVKIDRERMKIVFKNILQNGIDAVKDNGKITITTSLSHQKLKIEFQDAGIGMDEETKSKIFTPYFTNKERGMGLGLTIVEKIIKDHSGQILVESELGKGTTFTILLPV